MTITCYHCGGTDFLLVIVEDRETGTTTELRCVLHAEHLDLPLVGE